MSETEVLPEPVPENLRNMDESGLEVVDLLNSTITETLSGGVVDMTNYKKVTATVDSLKTSFGAWLETVNVVPVPVEEGEKPETKEELAYAIDSALNNPPAALATIARKAVFTNDTVSDSIVRSSDVGNWALEMRMGITAIQRALDFDQELAALELESQQQSAE